MSKRLDDIGVVNPVLTQLARGYSNEEYIAEKILPVVKVKKSGGKIPLFGKEAFNVIETSRAVGADSNIKPVDGPKSTETISMDEHDMGVAIDYREENESEYNLRRNATNSAMDILKLRQEKAVATMLQDATNYAAGNKDTLTTDQFNDSGAKPIEIIKESKENLRKIIGRYPNVMVMGATVDNAVFEHADILDRIKYSQKGVSNLSILSEILGIPKIYTGTAIGSTDGDTITDIWGDNIILLYQTPVRSKQVSMYNPGFGYTVRQEGYQKVDTYTKAGGKIEVVRATDIYESKVVGWDAGYLISDCLQ